MADLCVFPDRHAMAGAVADEIARRLRAAITARGAASLSLCGGTTPGPIYRALSGADLDWSRVIVTLSDERWVPASAEESNEALVRRTLLTGAAAQAQLIPLYRGGMAENALSLIERDLQAAPRPIDVGLLGIGDDGHTASLFPGDDQDGDSARVAVVRRDGPGASRARITMTRDELAAHRALLFVACGERKRTVIDALLGRTIDPGDLPAARMIAAAQGDVSIWWAP